MVVFNRVMAFVVVGFVVVMGFVVMLGFVWWLVLWGNGVCEVVGFCEVEGRFWRRLIDA